MKSIFALIDCNNFFVSCERLFRPDLAQRPIVVLSSNDGCVVSRSNEAKALGIPMGAPVFKYRQTFKEQGIIQFSGNFELYGDISERITRLLTDLTPRTEVYSVDEAFIDLSELDIQDYRQWGNVLCRRLLREVGIPVSIGIATTKTLSKLAGEHAKHDANSSGTLELLPTSSSKRTVYLGRTPINNVWGVGRRLTPRLRAEGIYTALDLSRMRPQLAQQLIGIHGRQVIAELNGICCHRLEPFGNMRQTIMHGRQFGEDTNDFSVIEAAIASLTGRAAAGLRNEQLLARSASVHLSTNRHRPGYQRVSRSLTFATPTADTGQITGQLVAAAQAVFNPRARYHRADVLFYDLSNEQRLQSDLFGNLNLVTAASSHARLQAFDAINARYGRQTIHYAAEDLSATWRPKQDYRSPRYTTDWEDLPLVQITS